jgi:hypothetical protein
MIGERCTSVVDEAFVELPRHCAQLERVAAAQQRAIDAPLVAAAGAAAQAAPFNSGVAAPRPARR